MPRDAYLLEKANYVPANLARLAEDVNRLAFGSPAQRVVRAHLNVALRHALMSCAAIAEVEFDGKWVESISRGGTAAWERDINGALGERPRDEETGLPALEFELDDDEDEVIKPSRTPREERVRLAAKALAALLDVTAVVRVHRLEHDAAAEFTTGFGMAFNGATKVLANLTHATWDNGRARPARQTPGRGRRREARDRGHARPPQRITMKIPSFRPHRATIVWTPEMVADLEKMNDEDHAAKYGISSKSVLEYRVLEVKKRKGRKVYVWTEADLALLATLPDHEVAAELGCSKATVCVKRNELGRPVVGPTPIVLTAKMDAKLGTVSDYKLGRKFGCSHGAVRLRRLVLKIAPIPERKFVWTAEQDKLLGTASDAAIGKQLGLAAPTVCKRRVKLGIASVTERRRAERDW